MVTRGAVTIGTHFDVKKGGRKGEKRGENYHIFRRYSSGQGAPILLKSDAKVPYRLSGSNDLTIDGKITRQLHENRANVST